MKHGFTRAGVLIASDRLWCSESTHAYHESPLHAVKIGFWCVVSRCRIVGPIFFEDTVTAERYQDILMQFVVLLEVNERNAWFQQDRATRHSARKTMVLLRQFFGEKLISKGLWPPRSPDLSPPDFFLWGHLKVHVYDSNPHTTEDMKANISEPVASINQRTLRRVAQNKAERVNACIQENHGHFQQFYELHFMFIVLNFIYFVSL
jgi:hypothetical protein